jgi:hypothetical protein
LDARRHARGGRGGGSRDPGQRRLARYHVIPIVRERPRDAMPHTATTQIAIDLYLHVRVLIGILLGLSVVRLVGGVARFVQHPDYFYVG